MAGMLTTTLAYYEGLDPLSSPPTIPTSHTSYISQPHESPDGSYRHRLLFNHPKFAWHAIVTRGLAR